MKIILKGGGELSVQMEIPEWLENVEAAPDRICIKASSGQTAWIWSDAIAAIIADPETSQ